MAEVTQQAFESDVMTKFAAFWAVQFPVVATRPQIASPNRYFDRTKAGARFIEWAILGLPGGQERLSNSVTRNHFRRRGTITWIASIREGAKTDTALELIELATQFMETEVLDAGYFIDLGSAVPLGDDGSWYQVSVSADWLYLTDRPAS